MTNTQLLFSIISFIVAVAGLQFAFYRIMKDYVDVKFQSVDNKLDFIIQHLVDHVAKIAKLEEKTKNI